MSGRAQGLLLRILNRIIDGPSCACGHDLAIHYGSTGKCLGANYRDGVHSGWCTCIRSEEKNHGTK